MAKGKSKKQRKSAPTTAKRPWTDIMFAFTRPEGADKELFPVKKAEKSAEEARKPPPPPILLKFHE